MAESLSEPEVFGNGFAAGGMARPLREQRRCLEKRIKISVLYGNPLENFYINPVNL
jgi:hypothetical protein